MPPLDPIEVHIGEWILRDGAVLPYVRNSSRGLLHDDVHRVIDVLISRPALLNSPPRHPGPTAGVAIPSDVVRCGDWVVETDYEVVRLAGR